MSIGAVGLIKAFEKIFCEMNCHLLCIMQIAPFEEIQMKSSSRMKLF